MSTRNTIYHHNSVRDAASPGFASSHEYFFSSNFSLGMVLEMHLLKEIRHLCKRYRISHQISVRDAASQGFESSHENFFFKF